jgi:gamma-carbonic anhydrase
MSHTFWSDPNPNESYKPKIHPTAFVAKSAYVAGRVALGERANIWPGCVLRADINEVRIGRYTNIQDLSICHVENELACVIGDYVTVGHRVILHACFVEDEVLVGMGSILMNGARVGKGTVIGAGSLVTEGKVLEHSSLYIGRPARKVRDLTKEELTQNKHWAEKYAMLAEEHRKGRFKQLETPRT